MRYFINILTGDTPIYDPEGSEFASLAEAKAEAIQSARDIMADWLKDGQAIAPDCFLEITDEERNLLASLPLKTIAFGSHLSDRHRLLYSVVPHAYLLLTPEFGILEANPAYLDATMSDLASIKHRQISDAFPDNPGDPEASGMRDLLASLQTVLKEKKSNTRPRQRYDVRNQEGVWETRYWKSTNMPVLDEDGEVDFIIHSIEDVPA